MTITRDISIEDLVSLFPQSIRYLMERGIKCLACGEPIWGTLESAAREKGFADDDIDEFVRELSVLAETISPGGHSQQQR